MGRTRATAAQANADARPGVEDTMDASDAESDETRAPTEEDAWTAIRQRRERKIALGGAPSRPIKQYRREDVPLAPLSHGPPPDLESIVLPPRELTEEDYHGLYLGLEAQYWLGEVLAWEAFLRRKQRDWEKRNEAAGGTVPPPPPITETDPLELHTEYLEYVRQRVREREDDPDRRYIPSGWYFGRKFELLEHLGAVERQVADIRRERGLDPEAPPAQQEDRAEGGSTVPTGENQAKGKRKREPEVSTHADVQKDQPPKRAKRQSSATRQQPETSGSTPSPKRRKAQQYAVAPDQPPQPGLATIAGITGVPKKGSKGRARGRAKGKGAPREAVGAPAGAQKASNTPPKGKPPSAAKRQSKPSAGSPAQGSRRSARIAGRAAKA